MNRKRNSIILLRHTLMGLAGLCALCLFLTVFFVADARADDPRECSPEGQNTCTDAEYQGCLENGECGPFTDPIPASTLAVDPTSTCNNASKGGVQSTCNACISSQMYITQYSGSEVIIAVFLTIDNVLDSVEQTFFNGIVRGSGFQTVVGTAFILYIGLYGLMIMFNLSSYRGSEVVSRLLRIGVVYMMTSPAAWNDFDHWVATPVINTMNEMINQFTTTAEGTMNPTTINTGYGNAAAKAGLLIGNAATLTSPPAVNIPQDVSDLMYLISEYTGYDPTSLYVPNLPIGATPGLDPAPFAKMFGNSMTAVFSVKMLVAIMSLATTGFFGWIIALFMVWSLVEFLLMMVGAIVTYGKSIIGLAFLFGIAPLFFIFLMFDRTRPIFFGWVTQVLGFALTPVMLFAFLSFYVALINDAVTALFLNSNHQKTDFCWVKWFSVPGALWDLRFWRPTTEGGTHTGDWANVSTGETMLEPINTANVLYFLMICHLGRTFSGFIETLTMDLAGSAGPMITRGADVANAAKRAIGSTVKAVRGK